MTRHQPRGRRMALPPPERVARGLRARLNLTAVLAVVLPALTVGALSLVSAPPPDVSTYPPRETELNLAIQTCPGSLSGDRQVAVASATGASGAVEVTEVGATTPTEVEVATDRPASQDVGDKPLVVRGADDLAAGLVASRFDAGPSAVVCREPEPDQWFTGLGAATRHSSVIELVNPDPGPAVADITIISPRGPVDAPSLRGITVPGGRALSLDLAKEIPLRGEIAAHVQVSRGRLGVYATDSFDELGRGEAGVDWLAPQLPGEDLTLLGLPTGDGSRSLVVANDGVDEVRATLRVVTKDSAFQPQGLDELRVPPGSVVRVPLSAILGKAVEDGALGVSIEATHPVTATLRSFVGGDVSHAVPLPVVTQATQAILPELGPSGSATVLLGSDSVGSAEVLARLSGGGKKVIDVDLTPGSTASVDLPSKTVLVQVTPTGAGVRAAVVVEDGGATVIGLRQLVRTGLVPAVRPALP
ncbi:MAG: DUF5719 family protein [Nocardioides sp.]